MCDVETAINYINQSIKYEQKGLEDLADESEQKAILLLYGICKEYVKNPFSSFNQPLLHRQFYKIKEELTALSNVS
ncbi:hypothetical protein GNP80_19885 [Aliivibrio fischeri]|uniref:hypothetical protein n=1 Tax=Aliivibrio fischeri TaxID=668 RepID=UPI0012DA4F95|nr:hypothetical protein [Aliivibrio fischeri]MUK94678.1 hypothetical protein [Aliivibrio fischeri]